MDGGFERVVTVRRVDRLAFAAMAVAAIALALFAFRTLSAPAVAALLGFGFLSVVLSSSSILTRGRPRRATLRAARGGFHLEGVRVPALVRGAIHRGFLVPRAAGGATVHLVYRRGLSALEIDVACEADGRAILRGLGVDASRQRMMLVALPYAAAIVDIGADGVLVRRPWSKRFLAYDGVAAARGEGESLVLLMRSGERVALRVGRLGGVRDRAVARVRDALGERTTAERDPAGARGASLEALLARGGRERSAWLRDVRALAAGPEGAGFRVPAVGADRLLRVACDARADAGVRAAAAAAVVTLPLDDRERERLRGAAHACAAPRLRIALAAAADARDTGDDDDALLSSLGAIEEEAAH